MHSNLLNEVFPMKTTISSSVTLSVLVASVGLFGCVIAPESGDAYGQNVSPVVMENVDEPVCDLSYVVSGESCVTLFAGQTIDAGSVCTTVEGDDLVITYTTDNGWELTEAHAWVGEDLAEMPQTPTGNPKIGNFPYNSGDITGATTFSFNVPLASLGSECVCDLSYIVAAHAALRKDDGMGGYETQTGWADGSPIVNRGSWATYTTVTLSCEEEPPPEEGSCETAFAFGETTFIDLGLTDSRWGWEIGAFGPGSYSTPIYAGAAQNDLSKGTLVGTLGYEYDGSYVTVTFTMLPGFTMDETHLFVDSSHVTTISPGLFGNTHDLDNASSDVFTVGTFEGEPLYIVAHAVVCE
jgi:hypothetical protein